MAETYCFSLGYGGAFMMPRPGRIKSIARARPRGHLFIHLPGTVFRDRVSGIDNCAVRHLGRQGVGSIARNFLALSRYPFHQIQPHEFPVGRACLDLLALAVTSVRPGDFSLSRSRSVSLNMIKTFIEQNLRDAELDTVLLFVTQVCWRVISTRCLKRKERR